MSVGRWVIFCVAAAVMMVVAVFADSLIRPKGEGSPMTTVVRVPHAAFEEHQRVLRLLEERDREIERLTHQLKLKDDEVTFLKEQLETYRDALATFQKEKQLLGAVHACDLADLQRDRMPSRPEQ